MKELYVYCESDETAPSGWREVVISREQILKEFWPYWYSKMIKARLLKQIKTDNCIIDFCDIHWAIPYKDYLNANRES